MSYNNVQATCINNGLISDCFFLEKGVRQGCPISPYLFILVVELLSLSIKNNPKINGFKMGNESIHISQLADDTLVFLIDIESLDDLIKFLNYFKIFLV